MADLSAFPLRDADMLGHRLGAALDELEPEDVVGRSWRLSTLGSPRGGARDRIMANGLNDLRYRGLIATLVRG